MRETGILSIVKRGPTSQVRYASFNPYDKDRVPYSCPEGGTLVTLLHHFRIDAWSLQQAVAALRKGEVAVLPVALSEAQLQAYFPPQRPPHIGMDAEGEDTGDQVGSLRGTAPAQNMALTQHRVTRGNTESEAARVPELEQHLAADDARAPELGAPRVSPGEPRGRRATRAGETGHVPHGGSQGT